MIHKQIAVKRIFLNNKINEARRPNIIGNQKEDGVYHQYSDISGRNGRDENKKKKDERREILKNDGSFSPVVCGALSVITDKT